MKHRLTFLLTALLLLTGMTSWGQLRSVITDQLDRELTGVTGNSYTSWEGKTSNSDAVYAGHSAGGNASIQLRSNGNSSGIITTASGGTITGITVIWNENTGDGKTLNVYGSHSAYTSPTELYNDGTSGELLGTIVKGESEELAISGSYEYLGLRSASGAMYLTEIDITWETGGSTPQETVATPTFNPETGTYSEAVSVTISCATEGATIYYTLDGSEPMEDGTVYTSAINITETTTVKAIATKEGYLNSGVASATYTISEAPAPSLITIAEARALALNEYALVQGVVTFIDGRNVYIQDETAGIDLYLNNNTVPSTLALGDMVQAYGKRATYNGLAELSGINGNDAEQFSILSSGNTLPLAVKTIAEILEGGADALQCIRVKVEGATIGTINTSGNTPLTQDGATINIYKVPALTGIEEGDMVDVVSVIGYFNAPQLRVALADDVTLIETPSTSTLTVTPTTLSGFEYDFEVGGPSEIQYFTVSGDQLTNNVSVIPSEHFEVSTQVIELFEPENPAMIYIPDSGTFYDIQICVRLKAGLEVGTYNEQITITSEEAGTVYVNVSGSVNSSTPTPPEPPTPTEGDYVRISDLSQLVAGSYVVFAARFDENATDYYAMSNTSSGKPTGVLFSSTTNEGNEILPATITDEENSFYWIVGVTDNGYTFTNAAGELIGYTSSTNFTTNGDNTEWAIELGSADAGAMVPNYSGFLITNVNNDQRHFALNSNHNFGPYHSNNFSSNGYNFYLDLFVKAGGEPPVPPTPTVATPTFSPAAGTYTEAQSVSITCATDGATIYYSTVSENGPWTPYSGVIQVEESMTIWAYAEMDGYNNSAVASATYTIQSGGGSMVTIFNQDWESDWHGWTEVLETGDSLWRIASYQGNHYAYANGYNHPATTDWLISPAFDLDNYSNEVLTFRTAKNYTGPDIQVYFSNQYDGQNLNPEDWQELECELSQGGWNWVASGEISLNTLSGTNCHIAFKYTSEEGSAAGWEVDDIMLVGESTTTEPVVNVAPLTLSGFTYIEGNGPSQDQPFTVSGFNLSGDIIITESDSFEISTLSGENFLSLGTITIEPVNGTVDDYLIYVRLKEDLVAGQYNQNITVSCNDVDDILVACSGTVTPQPVGGGDYVRIMDISELAAGNKVILASRYNETSDAYLAITNTLTSGRLNTTPFTSEMNAYDEIIPSSISADEDNYYWTVGITADGYTFTKANGDMIGYGNSGTNLVMNGEKTIWTVELGISDTASLVPDYIGYKIVNFVTDSRAMALRVTETESIVKAYSTSNINNSSAGEYNFFLDIFMQGEGSVPPTPTVAAPTFTPAAGTYYETINVTINCPIADTIYYSLNSENGPWEVYEEDITVDESMTIWAYATKAGYNDSPVVSAEYIIQDDIVIIFNQDWEEDWHGWTERCVYGDSLWRIASYQGNHYAYANGYNHPATEDWLISPAFDLDSYNNVVLTFLTAKNYTGDSLRVYFSNDYDGQDPTAATWQELECELSQGSWNWTPSGDISLDEFSGPNCYIGFKYQCTDDEAAGWEVDDIMLVSGSATPTPTLTATPNTLCDFEYMEGEGPSESESYTLTGANLEGEGYISVTVNEYFEISSNNEDFGETLEIDYADGTLVNQPVTIYVRMVEGLEAGSYTGTIHHEGGNAITEVSLCGTVLSGNEPAILMEFMPLYIQGNNGSNNNRVPVAIEIALTNLEHNTTYRYTNQFVDDNDGPETAGAGNVIYANEDGFYRSTSPSLATEGNYGEFTTNEVGDCIFWFINEPTANTRFTPGNHVYLRIRINDGHDGTTVAHTFTTQHYATVLNFGNENDEYSGSAFYAKSDENPMTFAMLYASPQSDWRPIYSTPVETTGVDFGNINQYADFYKESVAGNDGWFGGILPNDNETGINSIWIYNISGGVENKFETQDGQWYPDANTVNPNNGLDEPIFIDLTYEGVEETVETNVKVWSADHEFVIENGDNAHYSMTVYNILGQPMMMKQINAGSAERISHSLASGLYIIRLQNNQNAVSVKVIVK